jgi:tetratricopeptide (TPR) repeat protein
MAKDVLDRDPGNLGALFQLITWASSSNQPEMVKALIVHAQNVYGDNKDIMNRLMLITEADPEKRLQARMLLIEQEDKPLTRALMKADVYREMRMPERYFGALQEAEKIAPQDQSVIEALFDYHLGKTPPDLDQAKHYADLAVAADFDKAQGRTFTARIAMARKNYDEAARLLQETLALRPRFSDAYALLGNCYMASNKLDQAKEAYTTAYQQNPANVRALMGLLSISDATHARTDRAKLVEQLYQFVPNDPNIREMYIELQEERGDRPESLIAQRTQMRQIQPGNLTNLARLATLLERADQVNPADEVYRAILTETTYSPTAVRAYVDFLHRNQQDAKAKTQLQDYVTKADTPTRKVEAFLVWAGYLANCKEDANALAMFDKAIAADTEGAGLAYTGLAGYWADRQQWAKAAECQAQYLAKAADKATPQARLELVGYYIEGAQYPQAEKLLDEALVKDPGGLQLLSLRALSAIRQKQFDRAKVDLDKALSLSPGFGPALTYRALMYQAQGDLHAAATDLEAALRVQFTPVVGMQLAEVYDNILDFSNAYGVLENILREQPYYTQALRQLVRLCRKYQRTPLLDQALATAMKAYPNDPFFLVEQAQRDLQLSRTAEAIQALNQAAAVAPGDPGILLALMQANVQAGNPQAALDRAKGIIDNADVGPQALALSARANILLKNEAQADANFTEAFKTAKTREQRMFILAQVREAYAVAAAIERLQKWSALLQENWQLREAIGDTLAATAESAKINKDDVAKALAEYSTALAAAKEDIDRVRLLKKQALTQYHLGLLEESRKNYLEALKITPKDAELMNNLAWLLAFDFKKTAEAMPYSEQAAALMPDSAQVLDTYGLVLCQRAAEATDAGARTKDYDKACDVLNRSVEIQKMPANRLHLGNVYEKLKRSDDALRQYLMAWDMVKDEPQNQHYGEIKDSVTRLGGTTSTRSSK